MAMSIQERTAPKGMYRVIGVDTFDGEDWVYDDFKTLKEAKDFADKKGGNMNCVYVYDDEGKYMYGTGTY